MGEAFMVTGVVIVILVVLGVALGGWVLGRMVRILGQILGAIFRAPSSPTVIPPAAIYCERRSCRAANPPAARFCRRCGQQLSHSVRYPMRKVAVL